MTAHTDRYRVGLDIGGTFTDFVLLDHATGELRLYKCLTTPEDPSAGALQGLAALLADARLGMEDLAALVHGTTLVTNTIIERRGARVGLLTTQGFRDILEMGTEQRYDIHDLFLRFPEPIVPRDLRRGAREPGRRRRRSARSGSGARRNPLSGRGWCRGGRGLPLTFIQKSCPRIGAR